MSYSYKHLTTTICYNLLYDKDFYDVACTIGINPYHWADDKSDSCKFIAIEYFKLRESHSHEFAQHTLRTHSLDLRKDYDEYLGSSVDALKAVYHETIIQQQRVQLGLNIAKNPDKIDEYLSNYFGNKPETSKVKDISSSLEDFMLALENKITNNKTKIIIHDFPLLSDLIGGFNSGRIILLLGDTGFGKTNLAVNLANSASRDFPVLYFNMEMNTQDFLERVIVCSGKISYNSLYEQGLSSIVIKESYKNFYYTDGKELNLAQITSMIRIHKDCKFVFIDYDQKISLSLSQEPEWRQMQRAVVFLEELAKELDVCIILLAQQNSDGEISSSRRATFSASTVLHFTEENNNAVIKAKKNRFGPRNYNVVVNYDSSRAYIEELRKEKSEANVKKQRSI